MYVIQQILQKEEEVKQTNKMTKQTATTKCNQIFQICKKTRRDETILFLLSLSRNVSES